MSFLEKVALWAVILICITLLRLLIRAARRSMSKPAAQWQPAQAAFPPPQYSPQPLPPKPPRPEPTNPLFEIIGLSGEYAGQRLRPGDTELVFGRDAAMVHVVYPANLSSISKRHCRLFANSAGRIWIEDTWSANGTFVAELKPGARAATTRLPAGTPHELQPGDAFCLSGPDQMFRLEKNG
ncbi:MAG: FHA domain-containing protein [Acidobacteriota bacterium]